MVQVAMSPMTFFKQKMVIFIFVISLLLHRSESSAENSDKSNEHLELEFGLSKNQLLDAFLQQQKLSTNILKKIENVEAEQKNTFGTLHSMQNELQSLLSLPNTMEKYLEDYADKSENNSITANSNQNSSPRFPLLRALFWNAFKKFEVGLVLHSIKSCHTLRWDKNSMTSGVYDIYPFNDKQSYKKSMKAYCDMESYGGGWTVFQRRGIPGNLTETERSDLFNKTWSGYVAGFGDPDSDYWLEQYNVCGLGLRFKPESSCKIMLDGLGKMKEGLRALHALTKECNHELLISVTSLNGTLYQATYSTFNVASEDNKFKLYVDGYVTENSTLESRFDYVNGQSFSTIDRDNDDRNPGSCSDDYRMNGFWFKNCAYVSLNAMYPSELYPNTISQSADQQGMTWYQSGAWMKLKATEMKIRPSC